METVKERRKLLGSLLLAALALCALWSCSGGSSSNGDDNNGDAGNDEDAGECTPACGNSECGDDGCGGSCGECSGNHVCIGGRCEETCSGSCAGRECGDDGCGESCGACSAGFECDVDGLCEVDGDSMWVITLVDGTVTETDPNGDAWDVPGGMPDPYVCLTINGNRECSTTIDDTLQPKWNYSFEAATANALKLGVEIETWDEDVSSNDVICGQGTLAMKDEYFASGSFVSKCTYSTKNFKLQPKGGSNACVGKVSGDDCGDGICVEKAGGVLECAEVCDTVGESCGGGRGCFYDAYGPVCLDAGTKDIGESCGSTNDCKIGAACLESEGVMECYQVCSGANPCGGNSSCEDTGLGFEVCVAT